MEQKILVIDDELAVRELLYDALIKAGYKVIATHKGEEALEMFQAQKPDLALLDFKLPDINGLEVLKKVRGSDNKTKIVMLTGAGAEGLEQEARLSGASGFLRKSLGIDVIVKAVNEICRKKGEYKEEKILVIDDDPNISSLIKDFLEKKGYHIIVASSGEEGLEKFKEEKPILILLDVNLPGMDGIMTLKRIRQIDEEVGVIMVTAVMDNTIFNEAKNLGAYEYIVKPFDLNYLETCALVRVCIVSASSG